MVSTHLKTISQIGSFLQVEVNRKIFETTSYLDIYIYKYGIPLFGTNPYPTKQIKENVIEGMSVYLGMEEKKKKGILCAGVIWCVFLF